MHVHLRVGTRAKCLQMTHTCAGVEPFLPRGVKLTLRTPTERPFPLRQHRLTTQGQGHFSHRIAEYTAKYCTVHLRRHGYKCHHFSTLKRKYPSLQFDPSTVPHSQSTCGGESRRHTVGWGEFVCSASKIMGHQYDKKVVSVVTIFLHPHTYTAAVVPGKW